MVDVEKRHEYWRRRIDERDFDDPSSPGVYGSYTRRRRRSEPVSHVVESNVERMKRS